MGDLHHVDTSSATVVVAPGFIDSHTHLVFGGSRVSEYAARLTRPLAEVQALGIPTGIIASVDMTRAASADELAAAAAGRLRGMLCCGTTTVESKSGYGLTLADELKLLQVNRRLQSTQPVDIVSTFLGAHDFPSDMPREQYIDLIIHDMIPQVAGQKLAEFCDVFHAVGDKPNQRGLSRKHIMEAIDASLRRLGADYVDLYQIHRWDAETPIEETMEALNDVVRAGKALYLGASSMYAWQFSRALHTADRHGWTRFVSMQNHYNLVYREEEREMMPLCRAEGVGVIPWSPLARGFLAGNRTRDKSGDTARAKSDEFAHHLYYRDDDFAVADRAAEIAKQRGISPAQVALAWLLAQPGVTAPIVGASKMPHLEEAVAALAIRLTDEERARLESAYQPHPVLGHS